MIGQPRQDPENTERRFRTGETAEIRRLRDRLLAAVRRRCPPWLAADAEDIVQTVLARILVRQGRSGGPESYGASYLERAAQTALIDAIRARFRRRETALTVEEDEEMDVPDPRATELGDRLDLSEALRACLGTLLEGRRAAVATRLLGYSTADAASNLGWTTKKTEHLTGRGLRDLRTCLTEKGIEP